MQYFAVHAYDSTDDGALTRRLAARPAHLAQVQSLKEQGKLVFGAAYLNEQAEMIGSLQVYAVASRAEVEALISADPYTAGGVWRDITIQEVKIPPIFLSSP